MLKTPTITRTWEGLADTARQSGWSHEEYLAIELQRQVADREAHGTALANGGAHFPQVKTLEEFNLDHQPSLRRDILAHLATTTWITKADNVVLLGPPGVGKTHLAIGLRVQAIHAGKSVLFDIAVGWVARLAAAHAAGRLELELKRLRKYKLLIIDEIGYLAFDHDAANLVFQLVAARYEQGAVLATSNMPFGRWGELFSKELAAAMIDRLVHHAENVTLAGDSCRTRRRRAIPDQHTGPGTKLLKNTPEG